MNVKDNQPTENVLGTSLSLSNESLQVLVNILKHPAESAHEFLDFALNQAIRLTGSKIGYIYHYNEARKEFTLNTWSKDVMEECNVQNGETIYQLEKTGIWGEAVRQRKAIMVNDYQAVNPLKKGIPKGHVEMNNFLTLPVFKKEKIVGVVGLANKETDYLESDILQVSLIMESIWLVIDQKKSEEELNQSNFRFEDLVRRIPVGVYNIFWGPNDTSHFEYVSDKFCKMVGFQEAELMENAGIVSQKIHPEDKDSYFQKNRHSKETLESFVWEGRLQSEEGYFWIRFESEAVSLGERGSIWSGVAYDITDRKIAEKEIAESKEKLKTIIATSPEGIVMVNLAGVVEFVNEKVLDMWGFQGFVEIVGRNIMEFVHPDYQQKAATLIGEMMNGHPSGAAEYLMLKKDGTTFFIEANANILKDAGNAPSGIVYIVRDVTERKRMEEEIQQLLIRDQLTGTYNRRKIDQVFKAEKQRVHAGNQQLSVIMVDIDHFKKVNDAHGHQVGDAVLSAIAGIFKTTIREKDILGRWGGEEFLIICPETDLDGALVLAEKLRKKLDEAKIPVAGRQTCSFGVAQLMKDENIDAMVYRADAALYRAKENGRNRVECDLMANINLT